MSQQVTSAIILSSVPVPGSTFPALSDSVQPTPTQANYQRVHPAPAFSVSAAVDLQLIPAGMTAVKLAYVRVTGGLFTLKVTTADNTDQVVKFDDRFFMACTAKPITSLKLSGTGQVELLLCGDEA